MDIVRLLDNANITIDTSREAIAAYRAEFATVRASVGFRAVSTPLVTGTNEKYGKSQTKTFGLSLAQAETSGLNVCRFSTAGCRAVCVAQNGNGAYSVVQRGRIARTLFLAQNPSGFVSLLVHELRTKSQRYNSNVAFRLNTFSDIPWERYLPSDVFRLGIFYDYTKWSRSARPDVADYALVRSVTENWTSVDIVREARLGAPVVVFDIARKAPMPDRYLGFPVVDGDSTDERFADTVGSIVGLRAKGKRRLAREMAFSRPVE